MSTQDDHTFEAAQQHLEDIRELDLLAHAIALTMAEHPTSPRIRPLVSSYAALRAKIEASCFHRESTTPP